MDKRVILGSWQFAYIIQMSFNGHVMLLIEVHDGDGDAASKGKSNSNAASDAASSPPYAVGISISISATPRYATPRPLPAMLDNFSILTTSGVVLWSRTYSPVPPSVINSFISDVFIEERSSSSSSGSKATAGAEPVAEPYRCDQHTLKWALAKDLGVMFVVRLVGYKPQSLLPRFC